MPIGLIARGIGALARRGIIRGTAGRVLGGARRTPVLTGPVRPTFPSGIPSLPGRVGRGVLIGAGAGAGAIGISRGGRAIGMWGDDRPKRRRMNYANGRALSRAVRRIEGASKQYAKLLSATKSGTKSCGYTVKPKKRGRRCK